MRKTFGDFKTFLLRGNVVDLAVAVVIGAAFTAVVAAVTTSFINPLIGLVLPGGEVFSNRTFEIGTRGEWPYAQFAWGAFVGEVIRFLITAAVVFFFVVKPINSLLERRKTSTDTESTTRECPECLSSIPQAARRCAFCTAQIADTPS